MRRHVLWRLTSIQTVCKGLQNPVPALKGLRLIEPWENFESFLQLQNYTILYLLKHLKTICCDLCAAQGTREPRGDPTSLRVTNTISNHEDLLILTLRFELTIQVKRHLPGSPSTASNTQPPGPFSPLKQKQNGLAVCV
jgi:hypothetical protein